MNIQDFLHLSLGDDGKSASLQVKPENCTAIGSLYGGVSLASSIETLQSLTGRPLITASCQFSTFAKAGSEVLIKAEETVRGHNVCHANVDGMIEGKPAFKVLASFGQRDVEVETQWYDIPDLDKPEDCPVFGSGSTKDSMECIDRRLEYRVARGSLRKDKTVEGQMALWARVPDLAETTAGSIALVADYLPVSAGSMLGRAAGGNSLDNNLRILKMEQSEWVLCDCEIRGIQNGFGHATMNIWSEKGTLMAVASQSFIFRDFAAKK